VPEGWGDTPGCLDVGVKILPLQLKLIVRPLHLELVALRWHGRPDSVGLL
jgi:hypothetical protein